MAAERPFSIAEDFNEFGSDISALRKKLCAAGGELFDSFPPYGAWFRRRFGIEHEQAMELFHQTVSMKSVGNLTDFVRSHMLEPFDVSSRIEALIRHFDDLDRAHQAVLKAKRQVDLLTPLVEDAHRHQALMAEIQDWRDARDALRPYFAKLKGALLDRRLALLAEEAARLDTQIDSLDVQRETERIEVVRLERALRDNGGDRLEELTAEIRRLEQEKEQRQKKFDRYVELLARIDETAPADETGFLAQRQGIAQRAEGLRERIADLDNREREEDFAFRKGREEHAVLSEEIESLQRRKSNINATQIRIRDTLCSTLGVDEEELPFAGELIQVRDNEREWEGAAERLLRGFGLALLVPDTRYKAVVDWVDRQHLGARLCVFPCTAAKIVHSASLHPQSLVRKSSSSGRSRRTTTGWSRSFATAFDVACCDTGEQFRREARAITRSGQIKDPSGRHEKDDRSQIDDRARYVLGWSNADKLRALRDQRQRLEEKLATLGKRIGEIHQAREELHGRLETLARLEEVHAIRGYRLDELGSPDRRGRRGTASLEAASNTLQELGRQLKILQHRLGDLEEKRSDALGGRGEIKSAARDGASHAGPGRQRLGRLAVDRGAGRPLGSLARDNRSAITRLSGGILRQPRAGGAQVVAGPHRRGG